MLTERQESILEDVIKQYIHGAHPIGSQVLIKGARIDFSPATVRNELLALEEHGYLFQPHTSAGRIPSEKGWRYYLDHFLTDRAVTKATQEELTKIVAAYHDSRRELLKHVSQALADLTMQAVFVAFGPRDTYYTGISKLFSQPEFDEIDLIRNISRIVDHLDELMPGFFGRLDEDCEVLIGRHNPLGDSCGLIIAGVPQREELIGVVGPIRQDYDGNISLVRFTRNLLTA